MSESYLSSPSYKIADRAQPKLDRLKYSTYDASTLLPFLRQFAALVRTMGPEGDLLENFLDRYLNREVTSSTTRPAFLNDPALQFETYSDFEEQGGSEVSEEIQHPTGTDASSPAQEGDDGFTSPTADPKIGQEKAVSQKTLAPDGTRPKPQYRDLPHSAQALDSKLFLMLCTVTTAAETRSILEGFAGKYARYTFAVIGLYKHVGYSAETRRLNAMSAMQSLKFHGDPSQWKLDAISAVREIFESKVTMHHFVLQCVMQSFRGGHRDVQGQITNDINELQPGQAPEYEALFTKYVRYLSTLQASRDSPVGGVQDGDNGKGKGKGRRWAHVQ